MASEWNATFRRRLRSFETARPAGAAPAQVGLAWLLAHDPHVLVIPGTSSLAHLAENIATANVRLDPETMGILDVLAVPAG